jgi:hypothetical protein
MSVLYTILAFIFGAGSFAFGNSAGVPVFGLAFAAAGWLREARSTKRKLVYLPLSIATALCAYATLISLRLNVR